MLITVFLQHFTNGVFIIHNQIEMLYVCMAKQLRHTLAQNIKRLRESRGWSQEFLAEECGLHRTYLSGIERGKRNVSIDNLERLSNALEVSAGELLSTI